MIIRKLICPDSVRGFMEGSGAGSGGGSESGSVVGGDQRNKDIERRSSVVGGDQRNKDIEGRSSRSINPVARAIGLDSPYARPTTAADEAVFDDFIANQTKEAFRADEVAGIGRQPSREISPSTPGMTGPGSFMSGAQEISAIRPNITAASPSPLASLLSEAVQTPAVDVSGVTNMALARGIQNPVYEAELNRRAIAGDQEAKSLFDNALEKGYTQPSDLGVADQFAPDTLGVDVFEVGDIAGDLALNPQLLDTPPVTLADAQAAISADRVLAPAQIGPPAAQMQSIGPATQAVQGEYYGEDLEQPDIFGTPGGEFTGLYGFPNATALGEFQTQAMRPSKAVSQLMDFSLLSQGIGALTGKDPSEGVLEGGRQSLRDIFAAGGQFNPETGRVEAQLPSGQLQMNKMGMVTYSGMPDPNYTGPFANLVNPAPERQGGEMQPIVEPIVEEEPVVDPCPEGYALVDGVCQPTQQMAGGVTTSVPNPLVPPVFQPTYQPFQPQPLNPFVLSPTGAALGRSV